MMNLTLSEFFWIYLSLGLCVITFFALLIWRGDARRAKADRKSLVHCRMCTAIYEDLSSDELTRCPKCGRKNMRHRVSSV